MATAAPAASSGQGFAAALFMAFMAWVIVTLPPAPGYKDQSALATVFGNTPRIVGASIAAFWAGEFANAFVLARMKVWTERPLAVDPDDRQRRSSARASTA